MEKYLRLFAALERIFGKGYVSRLMGKQSNVITLPDKQARKFLDTELNVMEASEGAVKKGVQDLNNLVSDTKRLSTLNDQELLTITNNAERLAVKVNPPAPPPAPTADVLSITTKVNKNKDPNVLIDEYNKNQTRLRLTDDEGGTAISYDEFRKLQSRNNEIEKTLESLNVKPALDEVKPEGIVIPFTKKTEDFATGGRVGYAKGGFLKLAMKFFNDNNPVSAYKKYLKYVKETAQKDPAKLAPEVGGIVVGSELIHRGLRRKLKEVKEKNNENDSENLETDSRVGYKKGGITALKTLIKFLAETRGHGSTKGSKSLQAVNPKQFGYKFDMLDPEMKDAINKNRLEYLENLSDVIKADKKLLREMKDLPKEWQDFMYKQANEGGNKGRLDIYNKINIDDAIGDIEQMKKNLEFKNLPGKEIKRRMNAEGGVSQGLDYLMGIERRGYSEGTTGLNATPQQNAMISDMHKRGMDVDTISAVVGVSTQEVQDAINSQTPAQVNQLNPIGTLSKIGNFFSNPVVQGIGAIATGGLTSLGTFAKGQLFGHVAGNIGGNIINQKMDNMYQQHLSDRGLAGGYTGTAAQQDALASEMSQNYGGSNESAGGVSASEAGMGDGMSDLADGGRVGYAGGSILKTIGKKIIKKTKKPNLKRQMTREEIEDFADEYGIDPRDEYYTFDGTLADAKRILKESQDEYAYMYQQYKMGKLNPVAGEKTQDRLNFLRKKAEEAEMTSDKRLFSINEMKELEDLEKTFSPMGTSNKINISDPKTAESFTEFAKQNDPEGFKKIQKIVDDINNKNTLENFDITGRKKNAGGGKTPIN
jgi:uncharacterized protein YidB (DUF937 family)